MLAYLYLSRQTFTGEVFPASSSTGEAASRACLSPTKVPQAAVRGRGLASGARETVPTVGLRRGHRSDRNEGDRRFLGPDAPV